jgi:DNA polymerase I-like protein with 3'-5' exonuclease and polymerase domains
MMNAFETNQDIHLLTARLIGSDRRTAKTVNHASNYDMGFRKLALLLSCPEPQAKRLLDLYHSNYPGIRNNFHQNVQRQLRKNRTLTNLFGRKRTFMERWEDDLFRQAYAFIPQSTVVDVLNRGLIQLYQTNLYDLLLQVHDSIVFQVPFKDDIVRRILNAKKIVEIPIACLGRSFVIPAEFKVGLNWRDMESINVENPGRLFDSIRNLYGKLGTTEALSYLDGTLSDSRGASTESLPRVGP